MESQNVLGIYMSRKQATVLRARVKGQHLQITASFTITSPEGDDSLQSLAQRVGQECDQRKMKFSEAAVALDCSLFMQHRVHSEFSHPRQIAATVRFDTEEVLATDVSRMAVAFEIIKTDEKGSHLNVYTVQQDVLSDIILGLQSHRIDPLIMTPDACALTRIFSRSKETPADPGTTGLIAVLAREHGYFLQRHAGAILPLRTFMISSHAQRQDLLQRESLTTIASMGQQSPASLAAFDTAESIDNVALQERLGLPVVTAQWSRETELTQQARAEDDDPVHYAVAYGASLCSDMVGEGVNFRNDFMPHQGKRLRLQGAAKWASISVTLLLLAAGLYLQLQVMHTRQYRQQLRNKMAPDYQVAMRGRELTDRANPKYDLDRELKAIKRNNGGVASDDASGSLERLFKAMNDCKDQKLDVVVDSIDITPKTIQLRGQASDSAQVLRFFKALETAGIAPDVKRYSKDQDRVPFNVTKYLKSK